jgi:branched-chain amino acid transport system ATP-binding protein
LLDEILAGLTAEEKDTMCALLTALNRECGVGILVIEHDIDAVRSLADSVLLLDQGRLVAEGATETVLRSETYQHIYAGA